MITIMMGDDDDDDDDDNDGSDLVSVIKVDDHS